MICDADLLFSDAQAVTATAASTNYIDTAPLASALVSGGSANSRDLGVGEQLYWYALVDVAMTDSGSDSTIAVSIETDDNTSFSSAATVATIVTFAALSAAGTKYMGRLPIATTVPYERYVRLKYTTANGNLTTGSFTAGLAKDLDKYVSNVAGWTTGT